MQSSGTGRGILVEVQHTNRVDSQLESSLHHSEKRRTLTADIDSEQASVIAIETA